MSCHSIATRKRGRMRIACLDHKPSAAFTPYPNDLVVDCKQQSIRHFDVLFLMSLQMIRFSILFTILLIGPIFSCGECRADSRPNIVVLLVDDLGYADIRPERMPKTAALSQRGTQLNLYTHQNCAPTRVALMTGRYPYDFNIPSVYPPPTYQGVPTDVKMVSTHLKDAGYHCGCFGKWHLGWQDRWQWPTRRGFDEFVGTLGGHITSYGTLRDGFPHANGYVGHDHHGMHDMQINEVPLYTSRYSTHLFRDGALRFIEKASQRDQPFFMYVPFNAPHGPFSAPREYVDRAFATGDFDPGLIDKLQEIPGDILTADQSKPQDVHDTARLMYAASVFAVDDAVADIYQKLEEKGEADNTLLLFASDNGVSYTYDPSSRYRTPNLVGSSAPLSGQKGSNAEGGIRVANFAIWPGRIAPGQVIDSKIWIGDLAPTFMQIAGVSIPEEIDGGTILHAIDSNRPVFRRHGQTLIPYMIKFAFNNDTVPEASYSGRIVVIWRWRKYTRRIYWDADWNQLDRIEETMFDIDNDPGERNNLTEALPGVLERARVQYQSLGGDSIFDQIDVISRAGVWSGFQSTVDFGFDDPQQVLESNLVP